MGHWYARRDNEILIDLDRADEKRVKAFSARLCGAAGPWNLDLDQWFFTPSAKAGNVHAVLLLNGPMDDEEAIAWELYLLSDRFRAMMNLFRVAYAEAWPIVLIEPFPVPMWRKPDGVCECEGKHDDATMEGCPVASELKRRPAAWYVGTPEPGGWHPTLGEGLAL